MKEMYKDDVSKKKLLSTEELEELVNYIAEKMKEECGSSEFVFCPKRKEHE